MRPSGILGHLWHQQSKLNGNHSSQLNKVAIVTCCPVVRTKQYWEVCNKRHPTLGLLLQGTEEPMTLETYQDTWSCAK